MKRRIKRFFLVFLGFLLLFGGPLWRASFLAGAEGASSSYEEKKKQAEAQRQKILKDKQAAEEEIERLNRETENLIALIDGLDGQMRENDLRIEKIQSAIAENEENLENTKQRLIEAEDSEKKQYESMCRRIQYMYENGNFTIMDVLANSDSLTDFLNQAEYFSKITEYDNKLFTSYIDAKRDADEERASLELELESQKFLAAEFEAERSVLLGTMQLKKTAIEEFAVEKGTQEGYVENYLDDLVAADSNIREIEAEEKERIRIEEEKRRKEEEERKRLEEERKKKQEADRLNAINNVVQTDEVDLGSTIWPLPGDGRVYDGFGPRTPPASGASSYHMGVDIGGEYGASIVAVLAGTVETAGYNSSGGNHIRINHGDGVVTSYLHASKLLVSAGQYVKQGEVIALVGSTGVSTAPHLHFSLSLNGTYVDPMNYISYQ